MDAVYIVFGAIFSIVIVLATLTFLAFTWVVIISEVIDLKEKIGAKKSVKESEVK